MNKIIEIQGIQCPFKFNTGIFIGFIALIMLFNCIFSTFYENLHNFWMHNYFHMKFGDLMSNYLLYKLWKFEIKILIFGRVIENSLGGYFFLLTLHVPKFRAANTVIISLLTKVHATSSTCVQPTDCRRPTNYITFTHEWDEFHSQDSNQFSRPISLLVKVYWSRFTFAEPITSNYVPHE